MKPNPIIFDADHINDVAAQLLPFMDTCKVFAFTGPLGAGKTTLIARMLKKCGVSQVVTSPTFTYVNVYENNKGQIFYHFDLYRIANLDGFIAAGFDEYLYASNSWAFIEWPAVIMPLLAQHACLIELEYADHQRKLSVQIIE